MEIEIKELTLKQKLSVWIGLWLIQILSPREYAHKQTEYIEEIKKCLKEKE